MNPVKAALGDKVGDLDGAKVAGAILIIVAIAGFFLGRQGFETMLYSGSALMLGKCIRENT